MHRPPAFAVDDPDLIREMIARAPLAVLVTRGEGGMSATHLPLFLDEAGKTLRGHLARGNAQQREDGEALVIFGGPSAYVSPSWYASKAEHGKVVPTYDYEAVHVYGTVRFTSDADFLRATVSALTDRFEAGREHPWSVDDAPADYIAGALTRIVGVEVAIERIEAARKLSQNRGEADRAGVIAGLEAEGESVVSGLMRRLEE
jgi:transcriptional regulator